MSMMMELTDKKILVVGTGKSGLSICRYLHRRGMAFSVVDSRENPPGLEALAAMGISRSRIGSFDAETFAAQDLLIVSPGVPLATPEIVEAVKHGVKVIGDVELFALEATAPVLAVTGSNGKSTVASWLAATLQGAGLRVSLCGNIGLPVLDALDSGETPDVHVLELSSFQLEATSSLKLSGATVLNISEDHMDRYASLEEYARVKRSIYRQARRCVVNADDPLTQPLESEADGEIVYFTTTQATAASWRIAPEGDPRQSSQAAGLYGPQGMVANLSELPLPGQHNAANALAVLALAEPFVEDVQQLRQGLLSFTGLAHRIELVGDRQGVRWYNDSKGTNVDAACRAIESMARPVVLIAGGLGKGANFQPMQAVAKVHVKVAILIGKDAPLLNAVLADVTDCRHAQSMEEAVALAATLAVAGDAVLLSPACASFDMFDNFEHRGECFTRCVQELAA